MSFEQDWLIRQINSLVQVVSRLFFRKDLVRYEQTAEHHETDALYGQLLELLEAGRYGEAEDRLFDACQPGDQACLALALDFYGRLNMCSDAELETGGFSREEIDEGLRALLARCGIDLGCL